jgi:hypothetical protein
MTNKFIDLPLQSIIACLKILLLQDFVVEFLTTKEAYLMSLQT